MKTALRNLSILLSADFRLLLRMNRAIVILLSLIVCITVTIQAFVSGIVAAYANRVDSTSNLSLVEINTLSIHTTKEITRESLAEVAALDHVESVHPWFQHDLDLANSEDWPNPDVAPDVIWATTYVESRLPKIVAGEIPATGLQDGQIILPHEVSGGSVDKLVGRTVEFGYTVTQGSNQGTYATLPLEVVATYDNSVPGMDGTQPSYMTENQVIQLYGIQPPQHFTFAHVKVDSAQNAQSVQKQISDLGFSVTGSANDLSDAVGIVGTLRDADRYSLPVLAVASAIFGYFLGAVWLRQRRSAMGLLRAIGWSSRRVLVLIVAELLLLAVTCVALGLIGGIGVSQLIPHLSPEQDFLSAALKSSIPMPSPGFVLQLTGIVSAFMVLGGLLQGRRIAFSAPDDLLRER